MVARWDPQKDHANLLAAAARLARGGRDFRCVLVGRGMERNNHTLWQLISALGLAGKLILLGARNDIPDVMNAIDLHVLSSQAEAFPNVVAEAMACGTPCVVTGVGDASFIVGDAGWVVPPRDLNALADTIEKAIAAIEGPQREAISKACRQSVVDAFGIERMTAAYLDIWQRCHWATMK